MRKSIICILLLLFFNCSKEIDMENKFIFVRNNDTNINLKQIQYRENITGQFSSNSIENICYYIFSELKLQWEYENFEKLFDNPNFFGEYYIDERIEKNNIHSGVGYLYYYDITFNQYIITFVTYADTLKTTRDFEFYWLDSIKIYLNNNYLKLFPYKNIEDYLLDDTFGDIIGIGNENNNIYYIMRFGEDNRIGYCDVGFINGNLETIKIIRYIP